MTEHTKDFGRFNRSRGERTPLELLACLKGRDGKPFLSLDAFDAGERLFRDFMRAQMQPRLTASLMPRLETRTSASRGNELSDTALDARRSVRLALKALGPELSDIAIDFCCFLKGLEQIERERQWPVRSAKLMVRTALSALARHYAPEPLKGKTRHWGAEGFRPDISALLNED